LNEIHALMRRAAGLDFVPRIIATERGASHVAVGGRLWELTTWQPGTADFECDPSAAKLEAACVALARLHCAWAELPARVSICPAARRRLDALDGWPERLAAGWNVPAIVGDPVVPWADRAVSELRRHLPGVRPRLARWLRDAVPVQPCLCDVWHDHVLFTGDRVTGLVDYGSVKDDHVACDLARLLGSLVGGDARLRAAGIEAYRRVRPLAEVEIALIDDLDWTGTVVAAANWLRWLYLEGRGYSDREAVADRLARIVRRLEGA
jgi:Ser/Thr protein kinase RdoA (MazF antagonist)